MLTPTATQISQYPYTVHNIYQLTKEWYNMTRLLFAAVHANYFAKYVYNTRLIVIRPIFQFNFNSNQVYCHTVTYEIQNQQKTSENYNKMIPRVSFM